MTRRQFLMSRSVRQGCLASGFLFAMAFDAIFRVLHDAIIPRNPAGPDFLQNVPCAYAYDFAVAASSFRRVDDRSDSCLQSGGPNRWAQLESSEMLLGAIRQWKVWTSIGLGGDELWGVSWTEDTQIRQVCWHHDRTWGPYSPLDGSAEKFIQRAQKINASTKSLVERLCDLKVYALSVLGLDPYPRQTKQLSKTRQMPYNALLQARTMPFPPAYYALVLRVALDPTCLRSIISAPRAATELPPTRTHSPKAWRRFRQLVNMILLPFLFSAPNGKSNSWSVPWLMALWRRSIMCVARTTVANLMNLYRTKNKRLSQPCFATNYRSTTLPNKYLHAFPKFLDGSVAYALRRFLPHMKLASRASRPGLTVGFLRILRNGLCTAQRFHVEGEAQMCRIGCPDEPESLSHCTECPLLYNLFASIWAQGTVLPRRGHLFHDMITQVFLRSLQHVIVVMGLIDACVYAQNHHRRSIENFWWLHERENPLHDGNHSSLCSRIPGNVPDETHSRGPKSEISSASCQGQISASHQRSYRNTRKKQLFSVMGHLHWRWYSLCWWWNTCWMVCCNTISPWKKRYYVWSSHHDRSSSGVRRCHSPLQQYRWNVGHDWSPLFSWGPMAQLLVTCTLVFSIIPSTLLVFAWARFRLEGHVNDGIGSLGKALQAAARATHSLTCGVPDREE